MASHVVVVDASAKRSTIKTTPGTYLSDVRDQACKKLGVPAAQFTLKHNQKALDLTQTIRWANLPQGAKLDLVQQSRSPTVVTVALQLPASENNIRLTLKLSSNTTLWHVLRRFEETPPPANATSKFNFTQRPFTEFSGTPTSGSGRLNYEQPVLNVMGRERSTFVELQQTLAQLGLSGSTLVRLNFKDSGRPFEEVLAEITQYFESDENVDSTSAGAHAGSAGETTSVPDAENTANKDAGGKSPSIPMEDVVTSNPPPAQLNPEEGTVSGPTAVRKTEDIPPSGSKAGERSIQVFAASSSSTPVAATIVDKDSDFEMTSAQFHARQEQFKQVRPYERLLSDPELAAAEQARTDKLAAISSIKVQVRMPDEVRVQLILANSDTVADVYREVRQLLEHESQPFKLRYNSNKGPITLLEGPQRLVQDLGIQGRAMLIFQWDDSVSMDTRKSASLKTEWRQQAQTLKVEQPQPGDHGEEKKSPLGNVVNKGKAPVDREAKANKIKSILGKNFFGKK